MELKHNFNGTKNHSVIWTCTYGAIKKQTTKYTITLINGLKCHMLNQL